MPAEMKRSTSRLVLPANQNLFTQAWTLGSISEPQASGTQEKTQSASWRVDPLRNLIETCDTASQVIKRQIEPRLMHLLCLLAAADGKVLTRDELMNALWPNVIVNENSLTRAVSELRKALAIPDRLNHPTMCCTWIETLSKKGYRLNATVNPIAETSPYAAFNALTAQQTVHWLPPIPRFQVGKVLAICALLVMLPWTLREMDSPQDPVTPGFTALRTDGRENTETTPLLEDRVLTGTSMLPAGVQWLESLHTHVADAEMPVSKWTNDMADRTTRYSILSPDGELLAVVEEFAGQSQLTLRSLTHPDESWTAFTASSPITHLQWSPLNDGILFTILEHTTVSTAVLSDQVDTRVTGRLMLLDLNTMHVRELYRREQPTPIDSTQHSGSLT